MLPIKNRQANKYKKRGKSHYSSKVYSNPFFSNQKRGVVNFKKTHIPIKFKIIILLILILIFSALWFLFYSNYFVIKDIQIQGEGRVSVEKIDSITREQINNNFFVLLPQKNIYIFSVDKLIKKLKEKYSFDYLKIEKKLPNKLVIDYKEKKYSLVFQEDDKYYYADETGYIIDGVSFEEVQQKDYPILNNTSSSKINNNQATIDQIYIKGMLDLVNKLNQQEFKVEKFNVCDEINTLKTKLKDGPTIYFDISKDVDKQISKLKIIKTEKLKDDFAKKEYIDVRIGDSVYYR